MFDHIGRENDPNAKRRHKQSAFLTLSVAATIGFAVGLSAWFLVDPPALKPIDNGEMAILIELDPSTEEKAPAAPLIRKGRVDPGTSSEPAVPRPLDEVIATHTVTKTEPIGHPQGSEQGSSEGDPNGDPHGQPGGVPNGTGTSPGGGGPLTVPYQKLQTLRQIEPRYPKAAMGLGDERCEAEILIDLKGKPTQVEVRNCPTVFHAETIAALMKWRFRPHRIAGSPVVSRTTVGITYRAR